MLSWDQILVFSLANIVLAFTPGPDIIYVLTRGAAQGRKAGFAAVFGFSAGCIVHTVLAVAGLSALVVSSAMAFGVVKMLGAAYLCWIGYKLFRSPAMTTPSSGTGNDLDLKTIFKQSVLANVLNPKVAVFFMALFPQFIRPENGSTAMQTLQLGGLFILWTIVCFGLVAWFSGYVNLLLTRNPQAAQYINKLAGTILVGLGVKLAFAHR